MQKGLFTGVIGGISLALFLKIAQLLTGLEVYTLLLNVDFVPVISTYMLPE